MTKIKTLAIYSLALAAAFTLCASMAEADAYRPMVLRQTANHYALVGEGTVVTNDCTVTAEGKLTARVDSEYGKSWLVFVDRAGEEEATCEIAYTVKPTATRIEIAKR